MSDAVFSELKADAGASNASFKEFRRTNDRLAAFLIIFLGLSPIPLGSNRPVFWLISALVLATAGLVYAISLWRSGASFRFLPRRLLLPGGLSIVLLGFLLVQILPVGWVFGVVPFETGRGETIGSVALSLTPGDTTLMIFRYLSYMLFFFLTMQVGVNRDRVRRLVPVLVGIFTAHALYAMLALTQFGDTILIFEKWAYEGMATGTFVNRNSLATFLAMGAVLCMAALFREAIPRQEERHKDLAQKLLSPGAGRQLLYFLALLLIVVAMITTRSRMGVFAGLAGLLWVGLVSASKMERFGWRVLAIAVGVGAVGAAVLIFLFGGGLLERLGDVDVAVGIRGNLYAQIWQMIAARPFTGFGGGSFETAFPLFHELPVNPDLVWDKAHSTYLALWVEVGVIFGSIPLVIMAIFAVWTFRLAISRTRDWLTPTAAFGAILIISIHSLVDFSLEIQANTFVLLAIIAFGVAGDAEQSK